MGGGVRERGRGRGRAQAGKINWINMTLEADS